MKYIRTKEGIIVDITKYKTVVPRTFNGKVVAIDLNHWGQDNDKYPTWIDAKDIVNQADTIEELCDEFVLSANGMKPMLFKKHSRTNEQSYDLFKQSWEIWRDNKKIDKNEHNYYGAIWTDKGLIYIAKMNEEGELELL